MTSIEVTEATLAGLMARAEVAIAASDDAARDAASRGLAEGVRRHRRCPTRPPPAPLLRVRCRTESSPRATRPYAASDSQSP